MVLLSSTLKGRVLSFQSHALPRNTLLVASLEGHEAISRPYRYTIDLVSTRADLNPAEIMAVPAILGIKQGVQIRGSRHRGIQTLKVHGVLDSFRQAERGREWVAYRAVLVPRIAPLSLNLRSRIFRDKSVPQIVGQILAEAGLDKDCEFQVGPHPTREYVVQYQESDLDFMSRILEHEGIFYFFRQGELCERLVVADSTSAYRPVAGESTIPYHPVAGEAGDWFRPEGVKSLACQHNRVPAGIVLHDYNYRAPSVALTVREGEGVRYEYGEHYRTVEEGRALARVRAEEWLCRERVFQGTSEARAFSAGATFRLSQHYREDFNAEYLLTELRVRSRQALSSGAPTSPVATYENEFAAIPSDRVFRPERRTPRPRISGSLHARVEGTGDYAELDDQGRYRVRLPLDRSQEATPWVRMAQPYAGAEYGIHFPLHAGTEVLLTHANGDPDRPIIAAAVPNPETRSPVVDANQTQAVVKTAGNNLLLFDDLRDDERVFLHAQKLLDLRIRGSVREWVGGTRHLTVEGDRREHVKRDVHLKVDRDRIERIERDQHLYVHGEQAVQVHGGRSVTVEGDVVEHYRAKHLERVSEDRYLETGSLVVDSVGPISLRCGDTSLVIDATGITLKGADIVLDGVKTRINSGPGLNPEDVVHVPAVLPNEPEAPREPGTSEPPEERRPAGTSWVEIEMVDEADEPVAGERYRVECADGSIVEGTLDQNGFARVEGIEPGTCRIRFPRLDTEAWERLS